MALNYPVIILPPISRTVLSLHPLLQTDPATDKPASKPAGQGDDDHPASKPASKPVEKLQPKHFPVPSSWDAINWSEGKVQGDDDTIEGRSKANME